MVSPPTPHGAHGLTARASDLARSGLPSPQEARPAAGEVRAVAGGDTVSVSKEGLEALMAELEQENGAGQAGSSNELSPEDKEEVRSLAARDREVRAHEEAHKAAAGGLSSSGPTYEYETGPDGKRYAVGGEVQISTAEGRTPEETLAIARRIQAAALAPASPSAQDRSVAARAKQMEAEARQEIATERAEGQAGDSTPIEGNAGAPGIEAPEPSGALPPDLFG